MLFRSSRVRVVSPSAGHVTNTAVSDGAAAIAIVVSRTSLKAAGTCTSGARYPGDEAQPDELSASKKNAVLRMIRFPVVSRL